MLIPGLNRAEKAPTIALALLNKGRSISCSSCSCCGHWGKMYSAASHSTLRLPFAESVRICPKARNDRCSGHYGGEDLSVKGVIVFIQ